jgi:hypothetical protein
MEAHIRALRGAQQVTTLSAAVRRTALRIAASAALIALPLGCTADSNDGSAADSGSSVADIMQDAGADALLDTILGNDVGTEDTQVATEDTQVAPEDTQVAPEDTQVAPEDTQVAADTAEPPAEDTAVEQASCLQPNEMSCETEADCVVEEKYAILCVDGECHEQDMTPNEVAQACCDAAYADPDMKMLPEGCNPWGPPAPPADRGYRLEELRLQVVGVA